MTEKIRRVKCDVLVVGAGGAGLRAAIAAEEKLQGRGRVILATKGRLGASGVTAVACSDRMAFHATLPHTEPGTNEAWFYHAEDIYEIGGKVSDAHLARILAANSADAYHFLEKAGVPFAQKDGLPHQFVTDGSEYARACYTGPKTAVHIEEKLVEYYHKTSVETIEHCCVFHLAAGSGEVTGALALVEEQPGKEELLVIETGAVILATGGGGEIFAENVFPPGNSGDAFTAAYRAGAELVNMEFIQIGIASLATKLNFSGSMMRAIPRFINDAGEEFIFKYFPQGTSSEEIYNTMFKKGATWPLTYEKKTHIFDIAVYKERRAGKKVFLDYMSNPKGFDFNALDPELQRRYREEMKTDLGKERREQSPADRLREINTDSIKWLQERGIDPVGGDLVEIGTCSQHFQGGIKINSRGETAVKGLYAAGECAGGQHGANRPGGNALLDGQVFGRICGEQAAAYSQVKVAKNGAEDFTGVMEEELKAADRPGGMPAGLARQKLQELMSSCASVVRTREGLEKGLAALDELTKGGIAQDTRGITFAVETRAMLPVAKAVLRAALERNESRGPHLRFHRYTDNTPVPRKDPEWQNYVVIRQKPGGEMDLERREPVRDYYHED